MSIKPHTRVYDEYIGDIFAIPAGRLVGAELHVLPFALASGSPTDDALQLSIEVRARPDAEFEVVAQSPVLSQYVETTVKLTLPLREAPLPDDQGQVSAFPADGQPVARFRLMHAGQQQPRVDIRLIGC